MAAVLSGGRLLTPSIRYTDRIDQAGALASIGTVGDSYDNTLAESVNGLYKAERVFWEGPWRSADDLELATSASDLRNC